MEGYYWVKLSMGSVLSARAVVYRTSRGEWLPAGPWRDRQEPLDPGLVLEVYGERLTMPPEALWGPVPVATAGSLYGALTRLEAKLRERWASQTTLLVQTQNYWSDADNYLYAVLFWSDGKLWLQRPHVPVRSLAALSQAELRYVASRAYDLATDLVRFTRPPPDAAASERVETRTREILERDMEMLFAGEDERK